MIILTTEESPANIKKMYFWGEGGAKHIHELYKDPNQSAAVIN